jgi:hypothetical protein
MLDIMPLPVAVEKRITRYGLSPKIKTQIDTAQEGKRNITCFKEACKMFDNRVDQNKILDTITRMSNGLSQKEILSIFNSAKRKTGN